MTWGFVAAGTAIVSTAANVIGKQQAQKDANNRNPNQAGTGGTGSSTGNMVAGVADAAAGGASAMAGIKSQPLTDK